MFDMNVYQMGLKALGKSFEKVEYKNTTREAEKKMNVFLEKETGVMNDSSYSYNIDKKNYLKIKLKWFETLYYGYLTTNNRVNLKINPKFGGNQLILEESTLKPASEYVYQYVKRRNFFTKMTPAGIEHEIRQLMKDWNITIKEDGKFYYKDAEYQALYTDVQVENEENKVMITDLMEKKKSCILDMYEECFNDKPILYPIFKKYGFEFLPQGIEYGCN